MEDKDILAFMELQQKINVTDREMLKELREVILEKEKYGRLSPQTIKKLGGLK